MKWDKETQLQTQSLESLIQHDIPKTETRYPQTETLNEDPADRQWRNFDYFGDNWWLYEILAWFASFVFISAIYGVSFGYNQQPLPNWPYSITLNTLLSLLAQLAKGFLLVPIVSALGQIKWNWFAQGHRPLGYLSAFDGASTGLWGGLQLLYTLRGRWLGSLGAFLIISISGLEIFTQQAVAYSSRQIESDYAFTYFGTNYSIWEGPNEGDLDYTVMLPAIAMNAAIMDVIFAGNYGDPGESLPYSTSDTFYCPSGNCTFPIYTTLAVCSLCADLSPFGNRVCIAQEHSQTLECQWTIPTDQVSLLVRNLTGQSGQYNLTIMPTSRSTDFRDIGSYIIAFSVASVTVVSDVWLATECALFWCVQTVNTTITQGVRSEEILAVIYNTTNNAPIILPGEPAMVSNDSSNGALINETYIQDIQISPQNVSGSVLHWNSTFSVNPLANYTVFNILADWLAPVPTITNSTIFSSFSNNGILNSAILEYYTEPDDESGLAMSFAMADMISAIASGMTNVIWLTGVSDDYGQIDGTSWINEIYVQVRWEWLLFPMLLDFLALFFLIAVMVTTTRSNTRVWKSDPLALIFHGLDHGSQIDTGDKETLSEMRKIAEKLPVKLIQSRTGSKLSIQAEGN